MGVGQEEDVTTAPTWQGHLELWKGQHPDPLQGPGLEHRAPFSALPCSATSISQDSVFLLSILPALYS